MKTDDDMIDEKTRELLIGFVLSMENPSGGFNYPRCTPASIEETYFGLSILDRLGFDYRNQKTLAYLENIALRKNTSLKHLYQLRSSGDIIHAQNVIDKVDRVLSSFDAGKIARLTDLYYYVLLCRDAGRELVLQNRWRESLSDSLSKGLKHISTCQKYITVCEIARIDYEKNWIVSWVKKSQNPDGGFGFYPGTTSYLENVWSALDCLKRLSAKPIDPEGCREFVLSCFSRSGGFGRQKQALPTLEYSFMAVESLRILKEMSEIKIDDESEGLG